MRSALFATIVAALVSLTSGTAMAEVVAGDSKSSRPIASNSDLVEPPVRIRPPSAPTLQGCPQGFTCIPLDPFLLKQKPPVVEPLNMPPEKLPVMSPEDAKKLPLQITPRCGPRSECGPK